MKSGRESLNIAADRREERAWGTPLFACSTFFSDIRNFIAEEIPVHWHRELEFFTLDSGAARIMLASGEYFLQPGEGCFFNSGALHGMRCAADGECRYRSLVFDAGIVSGAAGSAFDALYIKPLIERGPSSLALRRDVRSHREALEAIDEAVIAGAGEQRGYEFKVRAALSSALFALCGETSKRPRPETAREKRAKQLIAWLEEHYSEPITLAELAASAGVCERECERAFESAVGSPPTTYLLRRRVAAAAELLTTTSLPVTEVGARCGFASPSYFAKQFLRLAGVSPRGYRAAVRDGERGR